MLDRELADLVNVGDLRLHVPDNLAESQGAMLTRADALRLASRRGIDVLRAELHGKTPSERNIKKR